MMEAVLIIGEVALAFGSIIAVAAALGKIAQKISRR